jgi:hypothetical protein
MIALTEEQRQAIRSGEAIRLPAPEIGEDVVLMRATQYDSLRELAEDELAKHDPLEPFIGAFASDVPDAADQHDKYLGQSLMREMDAKDQPRS